MKLKTLAKALCGTTVVCGAYLASAPAHIFAEDGPVSSSENVSVSVASTCMMSADVTSPHTATISNGTLQSDIGSTTLKMVCNDGGGIGLYAIGYSSRSGSGAMGDTNMYSANGDTIATGLATSGSTSAWAMKLSSVSGSYTPTLDYASDYAIIPSTITKVAHFNGNTDQTEGASVKTTYRAYVSPTQSAGTYVGQVKYVLAHPQGNTGGLAGLLYMQDMTPTVCADTIVGTVTTLLDQRDGKEYQVAKLADGNCWMIDNLRFGGVDSKGNAITADSSDTDLPSGGAFNMINHTPSGTPYTTSTTWLGKYDAAEYYPDESKTGNQYYGYLYNWYTAVAGTVSGQVNQNADASICPKGWTLPRNYTQANPSRSYSDLLWRYGIIANIGDNSAYAPGKTVNDLVNPPLQFVRAGWHYTNADRVDLRGSNGIYWSSSSSNTTDAFNIGFDDRAVGPQDSYDKARGFSVRCVAR